MAFFVVLLLGIFSGFLASNLATDKGHDGTTWFLAGFLLGPLGLIAAAGLSDRKLRRYIRQIGEKQDAIKPLLTREQEAKSNSTGSFILKKEAEKDEVFEKLVELLEKKNYVAIIEAIDKRKLSFNNPIFGGTELIVQDKDGENLLSVTGSNYSQTELIWQVELFANRINLAN